MKKSGILHPELSRMIASLGHTDYIVLADRGYPIPKEVDRINLGITDDLPTIPQLLEAISVEMKIDRILVTREMEDVSPKRLKELKDAYPDIPILAVTHRELKKLTKEAAGVVKTADTTPYSNMILVSG
ncbi:D-ribose pyranase [Ammoniphilus sp. YIM 78166]|uniref:D-ribose pyranase n=1 Tax=Ammoniphilus sp. YIM 78166 TaxID=1644106 RepID=UPI00106FB316|nr:D-ribose pyranase [Ammoniphilus sp. YIM 78166]